MNAHFSDFTPARELPCNIEAEQALLGALLMKNEALDAVRSPLEPQHFSEAVHGEIFQAIQELIKAGRKANPVTVKSYVTEHQIGAMTMGQYLAKLSAEAIGLSHVEDLARVVYEASGKRALIALGEKMEEAGYRNELDLIEEVDAFRARFDAVMKALSGGGEAKTMADGALRAIEATAAAFRGEGLSGVDHGVPFLNELVGPLLERQLIIIGGGTKQGKSSLIEQIVQGAAFNGHPVWIYSGEMGAEELAHRALSRITEIQAWRQIRGKVNEREYELLEKARHNAETWQSRVFIRDDSMNLSRIERDVKEFSKRHPGGMAVIDHIGLVERDKDSARMSDTEFGPYVTRRLKQLANTCRVPVVAAAQLKKNTFVVQDSKINKAAFEQAVSRRPRYADIFGSVEKDANHVIIPFQAQPILQELEPNQHSDLYPIWEDFMRQVDGKAEIILALSRHAKWPQKREVQWDGKRTMFLPMRQRDQGRMF